MVNRPENYFGIQYGERVTAFFDHANFTSACHALDYHPDYGKVRNLLNASGQLLRPHVFATYDAEREEIPQRPLFDWLSYNGFQVHTKPIKIIQDPHTGARKVKGSVNIDLVCAMARYLDASDHMVLFSGDGDLLPIVELVQSKGGRVTVVSTAKSDVPVVADSLRRQADRFVDLDDLYEAIAKNNTNAPAPQPVDISRSLTAA